MFLANKYINTLNAIKVAYNNKLNSISIPYNKQLVSLLNNFLIINYICDYTVRGDLIYISLGPKDSCYWKNAKIISTSSKKYYITYKKLHLITKNDFSTVVFLHTPKGILTSHEAIKKNVGGQVLFVFFS